MQLDAVIVITTYTDWIAIFVKFTNIKWKTAIE